MLEKRGRESGREWEAGRERGKGRGVEGEGRGRERELGGGGGGCILINPAIAKLVMSRTAKIMKSKMRPGSESFDV